MEERNTKGHLRNYELVYRNGRAPGVWKANVRSAAQSKSVPAVTLTPWEGNLLSYD